MIKITLRFFLIFILITYGFNYPQNLVINEVMSSNSFTLSDENGEYPDWLEIYNPGNSIVILTGCGISDEPTAPMKWIFPSGVIQPHSFLVVFCSGYNRTSDFSHLHTNFKISASGEILTLSNPLGVITDQANIGPLPPDISVGRQPDGSGTWVYFSAATPGSANISTAYSGITDAPQFSQTGGFFPGTVTISISESTPGASVKYTLNGSEPTLLSNTYSTPIIISSTKVLRARGFTSGFIDSRITTNTYLINEHHELPVFSISTDSANFFDWNTGIYVLGPNASPDPPYFGANFWQDWEKPIHIELYETNGNQGFSIDAGVQIAGSYSRRFPEKSLAVYARGQYGYNEIAYKLFPDLPYTSYQSFMLRNGGQDFEHTIMRDEMIQTLLKETELDIQDYRPAIVFLNGVYWGLHNLREKESEHYLAQHHGVDPNNLDRLELEANVIQGDSINYINMLNYIETQDMSVQANYNYVKTQMDVDNFISYEVSEIYINNVDWPGSNIKFWRERSQSGKWRWEVYDTDFSFSLHEYYTYDDLAAATATDGPDWPNPPWSTILLRRLLLNSQFKNDFINKFADYSNTVFEPGKVVNTINTLKSVIEPEMPYHYAKWGGEGITNWNSDVDWLIDFALYRGEYARQHFINKFNLDTAHVNVNINLSQALAGKVQINTVTLKNYPFTGIYFKNITITLTAMPELGYKFIGWSGSSNSTSAIISLTPTGNVTLTANFVPNENQMTSPVIFTEINYNSASNSKSDDWVEIYNRSSQPVNISGWDFKDDDSTHKFIIPQGTILQPGSYLVLCQTASKFHTVFPSITNYIGSFSFGLSSTAEQVRIFDTNMNLIDSVAFTGTLPWDPLANGNGPTLSLKNPFMDNTLPSSWSASAGHGSPGVKNDNYISRGDIDLNGIVQAYDASLVLQEVVGLIPPFVSGSIACWAADINQDGTIGAFDASWILYNVVYGNFFDGTLPKTLSAGGVLFFGDIQNVQNSDWVNVPVYLSNPRNVLSVYMDININNKDFELKDISGRLPSGWQMAHNYSDNKLRIALSGVKPIENGYIITIVLRVKDKNSKCQICATGKLNDNLNSDPGPLVVNNIPVEFGMDQNYPNPFNPNTRITYRLVSKGKVLFEIFNMLGEKVKTLVNAEQEAGFFSVYWDGTNGYDQKVSSGIYIYRLSAGKFVFVKKMTMVK